MAGTLFIVSTPIGNLEDITYRAVKTLKEVDLIAAEDTRRARILLNAYGIKTPVTSYHSYSGKGKTKGILTALESGKKVALISDSGTPGLSDPGEALSRECGEKGIEKTVIPGPTACIAALVLSGKPTKSFVFEGFLSSKRARRKKQIKELLECGRTAVVYESPHRIIRFLEDLEELQPDKEVVLAREITKRFEETKKGTAGELREEFLKTKPRGELTIIL